MALSGINLALAFVGQEFVWQRVEYPPGPGGCNGAVVGVGQGGADGRAARRSTCPWV